MHLHAIYLCRMIESECDLKLRKEINVWSATMYIMSSRLNIKSIQYVVKRSLFVSKVNNDV